MAFYIPMGWALPSYYLQHVFTHISGLHDNEKLAQIRFWLVGHFSGLGATVPYIPTDIRRS